MLSAIFPGLGQAAAGHGRRGAIVMIPSLALVGAFLLAVTFEDKSTILGLAVNQQWLTSILLLDAVALLYHLWAIMDAYLLAASAKPRKRRIPGVPRPAPKWGAVFAIGIVVLGTVGVHGVFADMDLKWQHDLYCLDVSHHCPRPGGQPIADASNNDYEPSLNLDTANPSGSVTSLEPIYSALPSLPSFSPTDQAKHWRDDGQLNVLLLGVGVGGDSPCPEPNQDLACRLGPDTLMVMHTDLASGKTALISIGRNFICTPLPAEIAQFYTKASACPPGQFPAMINSIGTLAWSACLKVPYYQDGCGQSRDENAYLRAMTAFERTIGNLLGVTIDGTVTINPVGLATLIDDLGGVDINVDTRLYDKPCGPNGSQQQKWAASITGVPGTTTCADAHNGYSVPTGVDGVAKMKADAANSGGLQTIAWQQGQDIAFVIQPGYQHMDGDWALAYARTRIYSSDFARQARQQCLLKSLRQEFQPTSIVSKLPSLLDHIYWAFQTNLPLNNGDDLRAFTDLAQSVTASSVKTIVLQPTDIGMPYVSGYPAVDAASWAKIKDLVAHSLDDIPAASTANPSGPASTGSAAPEPLTC